MDSVKVDPLLLRKISKRHFIRDIEKSFCFVFETSQQIWLLEASKVSAKMGHGWHADILKTKWKIVRFGFYLYLFYPLLPS